MQSPPSKIGTSLPQVTVQVLHWRGLDKTKECLRSLLAVNYSNLRILVVDNGSDSDDYKILTEEFATIETLRLDQNYGFAGGSNRGLTHAIAGGADFVWLINNDATVSPETLSGLVQIALANPGAGALGAVVLEGANATKAENAIKAEDAVGVGSLDYFQAKTYVKTPPPLPLLPDGASVLTFHRCQWIPGSNLLLRTSALQKTGLFDERYYLYFEDVELCVRLNRAGFACLLVPGSPVRHVGNASTPGGLSLWRSYYHTRNRLFFFTQNAPPYLRPFAQMSILAHFLRHCVTLPFKGKAGRAKLYAEWLGTKDFFGGKVGRAQCLDWCENISL